MNTEIFKIAKQRFLEQNNKVQLELETLNNEAEALGTNIEEYKALRLTQRFNEYAETIGLEPFELYLKLGVDTEEEREKLRLKQAKNLAENLGISWEDYIELNPKWKET